MELQRILLDLYESGQNWPQISVRTGDLIQPADPATHRPPQYGPERISPGRLQSLAGGRMRTFIKPPTATGIALAAGIPLRDVILACAVSIGFPDDELFADRTDREDLARQEILTLQAENATLRAAVASLSAATATLSAGRPHTAADGHRDRPGNTAAEGSPAFQSATP